MDDMSENSSGSFPLPGMPEPQRKERQGRAEEFLQSVEPSWRVLNHSDSASAAIVQLNREHLAIAKLCAPSMNDIVDDITSRWAVRLGLAESRVSAYLDVGILLNTFPRIAEYLEQGHLSFEHARKFASCLECLPVEHRDVVEDRLLAKLQPTRPNQATPTVGRIRVLAQRIIQDIHPPARPKNDKPLPPPPAPDEFQPELTMNSSHTGVTDFFLRLNKMDALELRSILEYVTAHDECTPGDALMKMIRGETTAEITLNIYRPVNNGTVGEAEEQEEGSVWGAGQWLPALVGKQWMDRVTHISAPGFERCNGYQPTPSIRASVIGRDGHCRFPGCDVPAESCDLDHVRRWDHEAPQGGESETSTDNLHCLCRKHHKLKTAGQWDVELHRDGHEVWTSHGDGHVVETEPGGVLKRHTFDMRAVKRTKRLADYNVEREALEAWARKVADAAREAADMGFVEQMDGTCSRNVIEMIALNHAYAQAMRARGEAVDYRVPMDPAVTADTPDF